MKDFDIEDRRSHEIFEILYQRQRNMMFEADQGARANGDEIGDIEAVCIPPEDEKSKEQLAAHHADMLQTQPAADALQKRLLNLFRQADLAEQAQGISAFCPALGFLEWYECELSRLRFTISGADRWSADEYGHRLDAAASLAQLTSQNGGEFARVLRAIRISLTQLERDDLRDSMQECAQALDSFEYLVRPAAETMRCYDAETIQEALDSVRQLHSLSALPTLTSELANSLRSIDGQSL